jgi:predicted 3-demethylubiquinone-9 3-methyltransferase (glyoxalase superfamily)
LWRGSTAAIGSTDPWRQNEQQVNCIDSPVKHAFTFTPSISLFVDCESEAEIDDLFSKLSAGGQVLMPLDNYGFSTRFGWVKDRFGPSWQLNLLTSLIVQGLFGCGLILLG